MSDDSDSDSSSSSEYRRKRRLVLLTTIAIATGAPQSSPRVDGRKSGKAREKRWCEEPCGEPWKDQRSGDLCQKWRRLLYDWKDETRVFGSWHSLEFRKRFGISRQVFEDLYEATA